MRCHKDGFSKLKQIPPNPPSKRGGLFGISSGRISSSTIKKIRCFSPPFLKGGWGGFAFHRTTKRIWTPPILQACFTSGLRYDCTRISGFYTSFCSNHNGLFARLPLIAQSYLKVQCLVKVLQTSVRPVFHSRK